MQSVFEVSSRSIGSSSVQVQVQVQAMLRRLQ